MKILCLHGYGTGPDILRYQLSELMRHADPTWDFHFLSGEVDCQPAPDIAGRLPGPYRCWTESWAADTVDAAHAVVDDAIDEYGPFDGVLGFSQGAAIVTSYLLEHGITHPGEPMPFRFAIFCSCTMPFSSDLAYCQSMFGSLSLMQQKLLRSGQDDEITQLPEPVRTQATSLVKIVKTTQFITGNPPVFFLDRPLSDIPCILDPAMCPTRLRIPTLHIRGKADIPGLEETGSLVESFCDPKNRRSITHSGGHDLPRSEQEVKLILSAMEWMVAQSELAVL
ncbi:serine hydrolase FSH [Aspergillus coremiiformis]|uniref:Serine hydrolase FSH n=1 Tax=Aspergillus coremiiformis TaxID=138285 RepID=A0A5N6ZEG5_9EURO|nr:serine hydrolase FSH [Aspergillus coremiiformis]